MRKFILPALFILIALITFAAQSYNVGFWGIRHGWTSSHGLAIMTKATADNGFVGYSMAFYKPDGSIDYLYFDRYPVIFSVTMKMLISVTDDLPTQVYIARQVMNAIFLATMAAAFWLVRGFVRSPYLALAITLIGSASFYRLYYKDMIHYDQPALLGMMLLTAVIARYYLHDWRRWRVFSMALIAVILGRGYASFFLLGLWFLSEAAAAFTQRDLSWGQKIRRVITADALWITVISVLWSASWLFYNIATEARIRGVPISETSVVDSALRRIPLVESVLSEQARVNVANTGFTNWLTFVGVQLERVASWTLPLRFGRELGYAYEPDMVPHTFSLSLLIVGIVILSVLITYLIRLPNPQRQIALLTAGSGWLWLLVMINLAATHDYVTMYSYGFSLMVYTALLGWLDDRPRLTALLLIITFGLFIAGNVMVRTEQQRELEQGAIYTYEFNNVLNAITGDHRRIHFTYPNTCVINNWQCHALGYYLGDNFIAGSHRTNADYLASYFPYNVDPTLVHSGESVTVLTDTLTPFNTITYLFSLSDAENRTAPATNTPQFRFGESLTLQNWTLIGDTLNACESLQIESWWLAESPLDTDYNMQIVVIAADGSAISDANFPLTIAQTSLWEPQQYAFDARTIHIPCDTPSGTYPLIMGVYDPDTLSPLPALNADEQSQGNQIYLTTVTIR